MACVTTTRQSDTTRDAKRPKRHDEARSEVKGGDDDDDDDRDVGCGVAATTTMMTIAVATMMMARELHDVWLQGRW